MVANVTPPPEPMKTIEQRVRLMIGDLMVNNAVLMVQLEECQKEIAELTAQLQAEKPAEAA